MSKDMRDDIQKDFNKKYYLEDDKKINIKNLISD
jgi:hypothetical protein